MYCEKCGIKLPATDKPIKFCPACGSAQDQHQTNTQKNITQAPKTAEKKPKTLLNAVISVVALFVMVSICGVDKNALSTFSTVVSFIVTGVLFFALQKSSKLLIVIDIIAAVVYCLMYQGVINGEPYFIRKIQGKDFVGTWALYAFIVMLVTIAVFVLFVIISTKSKANTATKMLYSDSDLMLLQKFDRYRLVGYYLLKARLHKIIKYQFIEATENSASVSLVVLNSEKSEAELQQYCQGNPQVHRIVEFIKKNNECGNQVTVRDIVSGVNPKPMLQSDGGKYVNKSFEAIKTVTNIIFGVGVVAMYYLSITKAMMGIFNGKPISNLLGGMLLGGFLVGLSFSACKSVRASCFKKFTIEKIVNDRRKTNNVGNIFNAVNIDEREYSSAECVQMLRAYVLVDNTFVVNSQSASVGNFSTEVFVAVSVAQLAAAAAAKAASSDSGCSGCSSCGGCGGGCGGCGGCGD